MLISWARKSPALILNPGGVHTTTNADFFGDNNPSQICKYSKFEFKNDGKSWPDTFTDRSIHKWNGMVHTPAGGFYGFILRSTGADVNYFSVNGKPAEIVGNQATIILDNLDSGGLYEFDVQVTMDSRSSPNDQIIFLYYKNPENADRPLTMPIRMAMSAADVNVPYEERIYTNTKANIFIEACMVSTYKLGNLIITLIVALCIGLHEGVGLKWVKKCFDLRIILKFGPASIGWVTADLCEVLAVGAMDPATYAVITQGRLLLAAITCRIMLSRHQTPLQWVQLISLTLILITYCVLGKGFGTSAIAPLFFTSVKVVLSVLSGVWGELNFKEIQVPFCVQLCTINMIGWPFSFVNILAVSLIPGMPPAMNVFEYGFFGGEAFGMDYRACIVMAFYIFREWSTNICVKKFDSIVKNICNASASLVTYCIGVALAQEAFQMDKMMLIMVVVFEVGAYSMSKDYKKFEKMETLSTVSTMATVKAKV